MLDVHILVHPETPPDMVVLSIASTQAAVDAAGYPVEVHIVRDAPLGHVGRARAIGYAQGSHPWVANVDDDDWVDEDYFRTLEDALCGQPVAVYSPFTVHAEGQVPYVDTLGAVARVFRRDVALSAPLADHPCRDAQVLIKHAASRGPSVHLSESHYHYRRRTASPHRNLWRSLTAGQRRASMEYTGG